VRTEYECPHRIPKSIDRTVVCFWTSEETHKGRQMTRHFVTTLLARLLVRADNQVSQWGGRSLTLVVCFSTATCGLRIDPWRANPQATKLLQTLECKHRLLTACMYNVEVHRSTELAQNLHRARSAMWMQEAKELGRAATKREQTHVILT
jgi:hypothetical protein